MQYRFFNVVEVTDARYQSGAALVEWLGAGMVLMLLGTLGWETVQWHTTRHVAQIALMEAARAGSVQHAHPDRMDAAFLAAFRARYPASAGSEPFDRMIQTVKRDSGLPAWHITQVEPDHADFARRHEPGLSVAGTAGKRVIRHDGSERTSHTQWLFHDQVPASTAATARRDAYDAPLQLRLDARVLHRAATPILRAVLAATAWGVDDPDTAQALRAGAWPIHLSSTIEMHSHAVEWRRSDGVRLRQPQALQQLNDTYADVIAHPRTGGAVYRPGSRRWPAQVLPPVRPDTGARPKVDASDAEDPLCGTVICCL